MLNLYSFASNGCGFGSPEYTKVQARMVVLSQQALSSIETAVANDSASRMPDAAKYDAILNTALSRWSEAAQHYGVLSYQPVTPATLSQSCILFAEAGRLMEQANLVAPDAARQCYTANQLPFFGPGYALFHLLPEFDKQVFLGKGCSKARHNIEVYDFGLVHSESKSSGIALDQSTFGHNEAAVLLWNGDVEAAKVGWRKQIEARKQIESLVQRGERTWGEYTIEELVTVPTLLIGGMLAAGEMGMVRELLKHTFFGIALRDPLVASEMEKGFRGSSMFWEGPDGYCTGRVETLTLQSRALAAVADDGEVDVVGLRVWLPRPDELIYIAEHEFNYCAYLCGAAHPAILCATLYATRLGAWDDAEAVVNGVLAIPPLGDGKGFGMQPLVRIEAWRLLARCRGVCGKGREACKALEQAASESRAADYVWMEAAALRDMLQWVEGEAEKECVQTRVAAVTSAFLIGER